MIFYTLQGPKYKLEIHEDKMKLIRQSWWGILGSKNQETVFPLHELSEFHVSVPKFIWGKLEWASFEGRTESFRFSSNAVMVSKIEKYMQKVILKNYQHKKPESLHVPNPRTKAA